MKLRVLRRADGRRVRWRNGGGWTTELHVEGPADAYDWRMSVAEIEADGPFSAFPGYERTLLLLDGGGIELRFGGADAPLLRERGAQHRFDGGATPQCRLLEGPTRDFNAIVRRDAFAHRAWFRPLVGPMVLFPEPGVTWFVHVVSGHAERQHAASDDDAARLDHGDSAIVDWTSDPGERQLVLSGGGELVLVRLERRS